MQRYSKQREVILNNLVARYDHPTAEMVYSDVRESLPNISLGTVYRNLNNLREENLIMGFTVDGKEHFDGNAKPHIHLYCRSCGTLFDREIADDVLKELVPDFSDITNVIVKGTCNSCKNK